MQSKGVHLVTVLDRSSGCFARGTGEKSLIKRDAVLQKETLEFR